MLAKVIIENGVKKIQALTADTGVGAPVGSYLYLEKKSNPQGYLYCDGSTFDETVYPALYQYLGTNVLPDWREFSAVGAEQNTTSAVIATHDVFTQGQEKDDQLQNFSLRALGSISDPSQGSDTTLPLCTKSIGNVISDFLLNKTTARTGTVTRGKSRAVFIYIKATSGLTENQQENVLNTINENNSYSTEEHATGKKWIDGKPIYSKVIDCGALPNNAETFTDLNIQNLATVVSLKGMANNGAGTFLPLPYIDASLTNCVQMAVANNKISIVTNGNRSTFSALAIVEYTKTTD